MRHVVKRFYRQQIPPLAWTPTLIELFEDLKTAITSSPTTARYDPNKPVFLKIDWSSEGMGWILMQPDVDEASLSASKPLLQGENAYLT